MGRQSQHLGGGGRDPCTPVGAGRPTFISSLIHGTVLSLAHSLIHALGHTFPYSLGYPVILSPVRSPRPLGLSAPTHAALVPAPSSLFAHTCSHPFGSGRPILRCAPRPHSPSPLSSPCCAPSTPAQSVLHGCSWDAGMNSPVWTLTRLGLNYPFPPSRLLVVPALVPSLVH